MATRSAHARRVLAAAVIAGAVGACGTSKSPAPSAPSGLRGLCGQMLPEAVSVVIANSGRKLSPMGRLTTVGNFPTGGRLSPDGRYYWSVSAGHGVTTPMRWNMRPPMYGPLWQP